MLPASPLPPPLPRPRKAGNGGQCALRMQRLSEDMKVTESHRTSGPRYCMCTRLLIPPFKYLLVFFIFLRLTASYHLLTDCECPAGLVFIQIEPEERRQGKRNEKTNGEDEGRERRCPPCPPRSRKTRDEQEVRGQGPRSLGVRTGSGTDRQQRVKSLSPTIAFPL